MKEIWSWYGGTYSNHPAGGEGFSSYEEALKAAKEESLEWYKIIEGPCPFKK